MGKWNMSNGMEENFDGQADLLAFSPNINTAFLVNTVQTMYIVFWGLLLIR